MEKQVIFRDRQEVQAADMNNVQVFAAAAIKHVVADGITTERRFTGFGVTSPTETEIQVQTGRLYQSGDVYALETVTTFNMFQYLAVATKRVVALVAFGQSINTDTQPRDFIIDITSGETEPQAVPMEARKQASLSLVSGVESADPVAPSIGENTVLVALITINTTGVENIAYQSGNVLPQGQANQEDIAELNTWRGKIAPQVDSLQTQIAALREATDNKVDRENFARLAADVAKLREKANVVDAAVDYSSDDFGDTAKTDTGLTGATAVIDAGLQFPDAANVSAALGLFNPFEPRVYRSGTDFVIPAFEEVVKLETTGYAGDLSLSQYQVATRSIKKKTVWNHKYYYGWRHRPREWWRYTLARYYPGMWYNGFYGYWRRFPTSVYKTITTTTSYNGIMVAQTLLAPNAFWLTSLSLFFTQIGASGDVTIGICETELGHPNMDQVVTSATVTRANLKRYPLETKVPVPPAYLEAGKRYAIFIITEGSHRVAVVNANSFTQGTLFYSSDAAYFEGDLTKDLMFRLNGAGFTASRTEVNLQNVSLAGGITDLTIDAEMVVPDGSELNFEIQVGGIWYPLTDVDRLTVPKPDIVPLRAVMVGTRDTAPGFQLGANVIKASRPAISMTHFSSLRTLPAASSNIEVTLRLVGFDSGNHAIACQLVNAAGGSAQNPAVTTTTTETNDEGTVITVKKYKFTGTAWTTFKIKTTGTGSTAVAPFAILDRVDVAL